MWLIYFATLLLGLAYGLAISVLALYLDAFDYSEPEIGTMATIFAGGVVAGAIPAGWCVRRFSAKRVLVASFIGYGLVIASTPFTVESYGLLAGTRFFDGMFSAGVWVGSETTLLRRSAKTQKGLIMSLYSIAMAAGYAGGPLISTFLVSAGPLQVSFIVAASFAVIGGLLLFMRLGPEPALGDTATHAAPSALPILSLLNRIRCSALVAFCYGYVQSAMVLFVPLYLSKEHHLEDDDVVAVPGFYALGMFIAAPLAGYLGDRFGQLVVMRRLAYLGIVIVCTFPLANDYWLIMLMIGGAGAAFAPQLPLALALQGQIVSHEDYPRANAAYNALYATGMLLGPPLTGLIYAHASSTAMMVQLGLLWIGFALFAWWFRRDDPVAQRLLATR